MGHNSSSPKGPPARRWVNTSSFIRKGFHRIKDAILDQGLLNEKARPQTRAHHSPIFLLARRINQV